MITIIGGWFVRAFILMANYHKSLELNPCLDATLYQSLPKISILVPAHNEEKNLPSCLDSLVIQNYPNFEIIVVNDRSTDRTAEIIQSYVKRYQGKIKYLSIDKLPQGWAGKNHALHRGVQIAQGERFLFTDADTVHKPGGLLAAYNYASSGQIDFLTLSPQFINVTLFEKMIQPVAGAVLGLWFPWKNINSNKTKRFFANGQFIFLTRQAYQKMGGHEYVKDKLLEDMALAERAKQLGLAQKIAAGQNIYGVRMYDSVERFWSGWRRIYTEIVQRKISVLFLMLFSAFFFSVLPYAILAIALIQHFLFNHPNTLLLILSSSCCVVILAMNIKVYRICQSNIFFAIFHPINCLVIMGILMDGILHVATKRKTSWRGVYYTHEKSDSTFTSISH
jgi:chlorobactene glucosyltransferase